MLRELIDFLTANFKNILIAFGVALLVTAGAVAYSLTTQASYKSLAFVMVSGNKDFDLSAGVSGLVGGISSNPNEVILQSLTRGVTFPLSVMKDSEIGEILTASGNLDEGLGDNALLRLFSNTFAISKKNQAGSFEVSAVTYKPDSSALAANRFVFLINRRITEIRLARDLALIQNIEHALEAHADTAKVSLRDALYAELEDAMLQNLKSVVDSEMGLTIIDPAAPALRRDWPTLRIIAPFVFTIVFAIAFGFLVRRKP